jgi:hypothetical protein
VGTESGEEEELDRKKETEEYPKRRSPHPFPLEQQKSTPNSTAEEEGWWRIGTEHGTEYSCRRPAVSFHKINIMVY